MTRATANATDAFARSMEFLAEVAGADPFDRLAALGRESRIFAMFREIFPAQFAALDTGSLARDGETRAGVLAFARLVSERLFPLYVEGIEECGLGGIPFISFVDHESDWCDLGDMPSAFALALFLNHDIDEPVTILSELGLTERDIGRIPKPLDASRLIYDLDAALTLEPPVLRRLGTIALIPARETDIVFYDGCCMCGCCDAIDWSVENVEALADHYRNACELAAAVRELSAWLDVNRPRRVAQAVRAWNRAVERSRNGKTEVSAA